jgi:hypothetical protein
MTKAQREKTQAVNQQYKREEEQKYFEELQRQEQNDYITTLYRHMSEHPRLFLRMLHFIRNTYRDIGNTMPADQFIELLNTELDKFFMCYAQFYSSVSMEVLVNMVTEDRIEELHNGIFQLATAFYTASNSNIIQQQH